MHIRTGDTGCFAHLWINARDPVQVLWLALHTTRSSTTSSLQQVVRLAHSTPLHLLVLRFLAIGLQHTACRSSDKTSRVGQMCNDVRDERDVCDVLAPLHCTAVASHKCASTCRSSPALVGNFAVNVLRHMINPLVTWVVTHEELDVFSPGIVQSLVMDVFQNPEKGTSIAHLHGVVTAQCLWRFLLLPH